MPPIDRAAIVAYFENRAAYFRHMQCTGKSMSEDIAYSNSYHDALRSAEFWQNYEPPTEYPLWPKYDNEGKQIE